MFLVWFQLSCSLPSFSLSIAFCSAYKTSITTNYSVTWNIYLKSKKSFIIWSTMDWYL